MGLDVMILVFWMLSFKPPFSLSSFTFIKKNFSSSSPLSLERYYLHIWGYWYFSQQSWFQLVIHPAQHFSRCTLHDGAVNPTIRKDLKTVPKFYCCPIEGCPRGPDRLFSQFSLAKQHCMKVHAKRSINVVSAAIHTAPSRTWKDMQRIVARPSSARVAVTMPATELAMRSLQNMGIHQVRKGKWKTACAAGSCPGR